MLVNIKVSKVDTNYHEQRSESRMKHRRPCGQASNLALLVTHKVGLATTKRREMEVVT